MLKQKQQFQRPYFVAVQEKHQFLCVSNRNSKFHRSATLYDLLLVVNFTFMRSVGTDGYPVHLTIMQSRKKKKKDLFFCTLKLEV